jgi:hypothetical protein
MVAHAFVSHCLVAHQLRTFQAAVAVQFFQVVVLQLQRPREHAGQDHYTCDDKERLVLARLPTNYVSAAFQDLHTAR